MVKDMSRVDRSRFLKDLKKYGLKLHHWCSTFEILLCLKYLASKDAMWIDVLNITSEENPRVFRNFTQR
jgi:hypothetical protein